MTLTKLPLQSTLAAACLSVAGIALAQPAALDKDSLVQASLIADTTAVIPGTTFTLGVLFKAKPDWHIYWKNPGATGFATTVKWGLPPGASSTATMYPAPLMFESPGNLVSFGYEKETMLMVEAKAANLPENGQVQITADAKWLMCSDRCIPNSKSLTISLPIGKGEPANQELFKKYRTQVPKPVGDLPAGVKAEATPSGSSTTFTLTITPPEGKKLVAQHGEGLHETYFFPNDQEGYVIEPPLATGKVTTAGNIKVYDGPVTITWSAQPNVNTAEPNEKLVGTLVMQTVTGTARNEPVLIEVEESL